MKVRGWLPSPCLPEPDVRFSRIRLSTRSALPGRSRQLTRPVFSLPFIQGNEPQFAQQRVGQPFMPPAGTDPARDRGPHSRPDEPIEVAEGSVIRTPDRFEIPMPTAQEAVQARDHPPQRLVLRQPSDGEPPGLRFPLVLQARRARPDRLPKA